ncbi:site-specific recombinase [Halorubrum sp. Atlit-26R]|uniref:site-specific recombinase n=1 Tax=Halorubrum sp. Atlit-26R TaxID=2282128 RepID=UPI000EF27217|nr:site-specific recombinase [Halorubrum sp. Atlit-26R]RLM62487.1 site-specific recombinase [Halorubrum sp. Atlit-26R]
MMGRRSVETAIDDTFTKYLTDKGKGDAGEQGAYRTDAERELQRFRCWCLGRTADSANASPPESWAGVVDGDTIRFADLDTTVFSDYARYLSTAGYAAGTVLTYYAHVASWCGWAHAQGYTPRHYARESDAEDPLPENDGRRPGDQQAWEPIHRDLITQFVDRRVSEAFDALGAIEVSHADRGDPESETWQAKQRARFEAYQRCREQALVYVVAYTGLRGSEFLSAPKEDREGRNGIRWRDVSFGDSSVTVFRKSREWKEASLPEPVIGPLKRYAEVLDVPESWPVFTTLHRPSLASHVSDGLGDAGLDDDAIERVRGGAPDLIVATEHDLDAPKPLTTDGARSIMERLWTHEKLAERRDELDLTLDGDYLELHGGRRGVGEVLVRQFGYAAAARYLDNSEEQVREAYQHIEAAERADMATEAFSQTDNRVNER